MRVIAITQGYDNLKVREEGEVFDMPDDTKIAPESWIQPYVEDEKPAPKAKPSKS